MNNGRVAALVLVTTLAGATSMACGDDDASTSSGFCEQLQRADAKLDELHDRSAAGGDTSKRALDELVRMTASLRDAAPQKIRDAFATVADGYESLRSDMADVDYDAKALGQPAIFSDAAFNAALEKAGRFAKSECDVNLDD